MHLVLIESDMEAAVGMARTLLSHDHSVALAHTGRHGLARMQERTAALLIVACMLPDMDGIAVIAEARARRYLGPILLLTPAGASADQVAGLRAGADECLTAPVAMAELLRRVQVLVRRPWLLGASRETGRMDLPDLHR